MSSSPESRFNRFHVYSTYYKTIHRSHGSRHAARPTSSWQPDSYPQEPHKIAVHILIPRTMRPGPSPLFVKFHGGGLVAGDANYPPWWAHWLVPFVIRNNAIAIIPDYRLMPEHQGDEIMEDVRDFWEWVGGKGVRGRKRVLGSKPSNARKNGHGGDEDDEEEQWEQGGLQEEVARHNWEVDIDWEKVCIDGDSAGGLLALQSVLLETVQKVPSLSAAAAASATGFQSWMESHIRECEKPKRKTSINIRALVLHYTMTTILSRKPSRFGPHDTPTPADGSIIDEHIEAITPGTVISRSTPWKRFPLSYALSAFGHWRDCYGDEPELLPITAIDRFAHDPEKWRKCLPPMLFLHADKDTAVDVGTAEKFCEKMTGLLGEEWASENIRLEIKGGEHGFDLNLGEEDNKWLRDAVKWIEDRWMGEV